MVIFWFDVALDNVILLFLLFFHQPVSTSPNSTFKAFLRGVSGLLFGIGGISFLFGGRAIRGFTKADIVLSEMGGIFIALVCMGLGALAKSAGEEDVSEDGRAVKLIGFPRSARDKKN